MLSSARPAPTCRPPPRAPTSRSSPHAATGKRRGSRTNRVTSMAADCANTSFIPGGCSQGGSVTDSVLGIRTRPGSGRVIPAGLADRVKAVVVFRNPVCGNGSNGAAHMTYPLNGSVEQGARFAAERIDQG
ncbi:cutinase family protein [Streptomyces sp. NPDC059272]|uniref:cutinase family protein n=1 Tax=Streptomyces sp. NPDC059272 TaxID=3346800 RepID=UPI00368E4F40